MLQPTVPAWFEIPAHDLERAVRFYERLLSATLKRETVGPVELAVFPHRKPGGGALVKSPERTPSAAGTIVYLNLDDLAPVLGRVEQAGGSVLQPRTELPDGIGVFAEIRDSEGNRVGLFSAA